MVSPPAPPRVYSVATGGLLRAWTGPDPAGPLVHGSWSYVSDSNTSLSWIAGGRELTFLYRQQERLTGLGVAGGTTVRALDPARPGHDLLADSRVLLGPASLPPDGCRSVLVTADGRSVVCGTQTLSGRPRPGGCPVTEPGFAEYSTATGRLAGYLYRHTGTCYYGWADVMGAGPSAGTLIGSLSLLVVAPKPHWVTDVGVFTRGEFVPLPLPDGTTGPGEIAF